MSQPLGQHFLKNQTALSRIVDAIELQKGATVIEIGPGKGALTIPLAQKCKEVGAKLIVVEKDAELADLLISESVNRQEQMEIITGDALRVLPELINRLTDQPINYSLIGNIPYYITGFLFRTISELSNKPKEAVFLIQKEVAERVSAKEGEMNLLASSVQVWADAEMLFEIPPEDFDPPPQVYSAVIKLTTKKTQLPEKKVAEYYETIKVVFKQPRKTLLNNLSAVIGREKAKSAMGLLKFFPETRPQDLSIEKIIALSDILHSSR